MKAVESGEESLRVVLDVVVVLLQDPQQELVLAVTDGLYYEAIVAREVKERPRLAGRAKLG